MMRATIIKIHPLKWGQKYRAYYNRVEFILEDGSWAHTDIVQGFRNAARWTPLKLNQSFSGVRLMDKGKIDADSPVVPDDGPPCKYISQKKPKLKQPDLFL